MLLTFTNHYQTKLPLDNPHFDIFMVIVFLGLFLLTLQKNIGDFPLSILQRNQIKGLAILFIIFNHLCYYTEPSPSLYMIWSEFGMVGVAIFFIFSGYGTCLSIQARGINIYHKKDNRYIYSLDIRTVLTASTLCNFHAEHGE
ncbi:acyltransferase family protein [Microseira sp. BLCC-F43]|jgi:hypothetical protein|uniref:acyltransferase family protein n=1 Tax=Microseira sp. BLCC-F43 TaxID=3153602 RepID=UPI0035BB3D8D